MTDNAELESFRRQWREEVAHRSRPTPPGPSQPRQTAPSVARPSHFPSSRHEVSERDDIEDEEWRAPFEQGVLARAVGKLNLKAPEYDASHSQTPREDPNSALEHFERAVQKEAEGNLGDSLQHYRRAYRLDSTVDKAYRNKHFAWAWKKPAQAPGPSSKTVPAANKQSDDKQSDDKQSDDKQSDDKQSDDAPEMLPTPELIASFANLPIPQAEPVIENDPPPPCPISKVPPEVLVEILRHVALMDPALFYRTSLVCKRFAYHFAEEQHIWKRICQSSEFGFKEMHYSFACDVFGEREHTLGPRFTLFPLIPSVQIPKPLSSWSEVFQMYPRIRFTGIYISTVNYTRAGAASAYQNVAWNSPIHIVTYYRYIRFYPDGTVVSLLTTVEPQVLVPHISTENLIAARTVTHKKHRRKTSEGGTTLSGASDPVPPVATSALTQAQRGRWRLAHPSPDSESSEGASPDSISKFLSSTNKTSSDDVLDPRDIIIETEGVAPRYTYVLYLTLRSSSRASRTHSGGALPPNPSRNTKLTWKGYWSYDSLTDDWAEFGLRNDRTFVFRRVRGWGMNE